MNDMIRLVQLSHPRHGRVVAKVDEPRLRLLPGFASLYDLAMQAMTDGARIEAIIQPINPLESIDYASVYAGEAEWSLLPPFDHPRDPAHCLITGTGLTHKASAENRQSMHGAIEHETDSMKMYRIGIEGGRPSPGQIGAAPEWFYKGTGTILRAPGAALDLPWHGDDGGEEAEIAGCYIIAPDGSPRRVGLAQSNEFSDHVLEATNYLYLAQSKLRQCALGPEIVIGSDLSHEVKGHASIERGGRTIWTGELASGEPWMCHTLTNLEHHHFKHTEHRHPGDAHIHFFGADNFSYKDRLRLEDGDVMEVGFEGFGRALRNPIHIERTAHLSIEIKVL
jgi:hypothetical protein